MLCGLPTGQLKEVYYMAQKEGKYFIEAEVRVPYVRTEVRNVAVKGTNSDTAIAKYELELKEQGLSVTSISKRTSAIPGIICFSIALVMSFFRYFEEGGFNYIYLYPNIVSVLLSVVIYSSFVIRIKGIQNTFKNSLDTIISMLFILVFAMFIQIFTSNSKISSGLIGKILSKLGLGNSYYLIIAAIVLSWLGIKQVCGFVWLAIFALALTELVTCGNYMGNVKGSVFILSSFCGFVFFLKYEGKLIINSFRKLAISSSTFVKSDLDESKKLAQSGINTVSSMLVGKELCHKNEKLIEEGKQNED